MINESRAQTFIDGYWEEEILPTLAEYIRIPNVSPEFDPDWQANGHHARALKLVEDWLEAHKPEGSTLHVGHLEGRTPLLLLEVPGDSDRTVLMYGHLDKQPEMVGWREGLGAWEPVREGDRLYGRGGADDGYAVFASLAALLALRDQGVPHARTVMIIEFSEESGSPDLPAYVEHFADRIGRPELVVCLDSGAGNYEQLWSTTSLRGVIAGRLRVDVLTEGVHSGDASGIVPSSFRILRALLSRLEDEVTGEIRPASLHVEIPTERREQARKVAGVLTEPYGAFPWVEGMKPVTGDWTEQILNRTWQPALAVTGQEGMPALKDAGNVLRPFTTLALSLRLPPTVDPTAAQETLQKLLTENVPYGAKVSLDFSEPAAGWNAPPLAPWLAEALDEASQARYGRPALHMGEGGSIPFMAMLGERFPKAQFVITGVLGPESNAHGPNEFLHVPYAQKLTGCMADVLARHLERGTE
jgi:acetylornithine deacetylase/succinyl-diaminopimelate desuccinylase-like protein